VDTEIYERFKEYSESETGKSSKGVGETLEKAMLEYMDDDRLSRIENKVDRLLDGSTQKEKTPKTGDPSRREKRLRQIESDLAGEDEVVTQEDVNDLIRKHAGGSKPTLREYNRRLRERKSVFPRPNHDSIVYTDAERFVREVNELAESKSLRPATYEETVERYGRAWWQRHLPASDEPDDDRAFS